MLMEGEKRNSDIAANRNEAVNGIVALMMAW